MYLEFTPATLTRAPGHDAGCADQLSRLMADAECGLGFTNPLSDGAFAARGARVAWPAYVGLVAVLAAGGGYQATLFVCDRLAQPAAVSMHKPAAKPASVGAAKLTVPAPRPPIDATPSRTAAAVVVPLQLLAATPPRAPKVLRSAAARTPQPGAAQSLRASAPAVLPSVQPSADNEVESSVRAETESSSGDSARATELPTAEPPSAPAQPADVPTRRVQPLQLAAAEPRPKLAPALPVLELLNVHGSLTKRRAQRGIARIEPEVASCLRSMPSSSAALGTWALSTSIDPHGRAGATHIESPAPRPQLEKCLERAAHHLQVEVPDTGGALIEWTVRPRPE